MRLREGYEGRKWKKQELRASGFHVPAGWKGFIRGWHCPQTARLLSLPMSVYFCLCLIVPCRWQCLTLAYVLLVYAQEEDSFFSLKHDFWATPHCPALCCPWLPQSPLQPVLHLPQPRANTQSHHLLEKCKSLTVSWEMARGKVPEAPWSCWMCHPEPKGPRSAPCTCPEKTPVLPHHSNHRRVHFLKATLLL